MRRGTDRDLTLEFTSDISEITILRVDIKQSDTVEKIEDFSLDANKLVAPISQEMINKFKKGRCQIQVRYRKKDSRVDATEIIETYIYDVLEDEVL